MGEVAELAIREARALRMEVGVDALIDGLQNDARACPADRRLLALYFDMSAMPIPDQLRAFSATLKFLKTQTTPADLVALMQFTNESVKVLQDFTDDRDQ